MSQNTAIEWTDATWNPVRGCSRVSEGCRNCYAERQAARFASPPVAGVGQDDSDASPGGPFYGFVTKVNGHAAWTGKVELVEKHLMDPLKWRTSRKVFVNSMSDLFHEELTDEAIDRVFAVMVAAYWHQFQILTKRAGRLPSYIEGLRKRWIGATGLAYPGPNINGPFKWPAPNIWLGVSVEDQKTADERVPLLLQTPAAVRFVSYEPALGPVDFESIPFCLRDNHPTAADVKVDNPLCFHYIRHGTPGINWIIVGGESGPGARPFNIDWARNTVAQCRAAGVACFVKQLGAKVFDSGHVHILLNDHKGGKPNEWPADLRVREFPQVEVLQA